MAKLEIDLAPEEQTRLEQQAQRAGLPINDWIRQRLFDEPVLPAVINKTVVTFETDDGDFFEIPDLPDDLGGATAIASEAALGKFWNSREDSAAWNSM